MINKQVKLVKRPTGFPTAENWQLTETPVPEIGQDEVLVKVTHLSIDPAMRGWINEGKSYIEPVALGATMRAIGVGEVIATKSDLVGIGDEVCGILNCQSYAVTNAKNLTKVSSKVAPLPTYLGALGMPGLTAYFGLLRVGALQSGETVLVSGGAGAVGAVVGQIAKDLECHVIGIAGGQEKCQYMKDLGFDEVIDYKNEKIGRSLRKLAPKGIDVYFDNVGGEALDAALANLRLNARVVICGAISQYNSTSMTGPSQYLSLLVNRAKMEGFIVFDFIKEYDVATKKLVSMYQKGTLKTKEHVIDGLENFNTALNMLFTGSNFGKLILKI